MKQQLKDLRIPFEETDQTWNAWLYKLVENWETTLTSQTGSTKNTNANFIYNRKYENKKLGDDYVGETAKH